jgi:hypothetical protein
MEKYTELIKGKLVLVNEGKLGIEIRKIKSESKTLITIIVDNEK